MHAGLERILIWLAVIRGFRNVRNTQHQKPEFDPTPGEIKEKPAKERISIQRAVKLRKAHHFLW
jgi:hypothetical protein